MECNVLRNPEILTGNPRTQAQCTGISSYTTTRCQMTLQGHFSESSNPIHVASLATESEADN